jgi:hypothetical protein
MLLEVLIGRVPYEPHFGLDSEENYNPIKSKIFED